MTKNPFPPHYANNITEQQLPAELIQDFTTIEYILPNQGGQGPTKPIFLLMVDTAVCSEELAELKDSLQQSINFIPEDALIGLITYGKMVFLHELGFSHCPKAYVFRGDVAHQPKDVQEQLGLNLGSDPLHKGDSQALKRFLVPVSECEFALNSILDDLQPDPWPAAKGCRPARSVGTALNIAISLLEIAGSNTRGSRIINLLGGPVTSGPGKIVAEELSEKIRSHLDIQKERENTRHLKAATKFYQECAARAQAAGIVIDVFVAALDQVGIIEMKSCIEMTGGFYIMTDSFGNPVFKESFKRFFEVDENGDLKMGFLATTKVLTAPDFKVSGAIGQCAPVKG
jgi:protein transport protein SEC23